MRVSALYVRFFKAFNFDYLRKSDPRVESKPWEFVDSLWFPHVKIDIEPDVTTVVGSNESGKSQLLSAIKCALSGDGIERGDFCRYSNLFTVDDSKRLPEFGVELDGLTEEERAGVASAVGLDESVLSRFVLFRTQGKVVVYVPTGDDWSEHEVKKPAALTKLLPVFFEINSKIPLPDSAPLDYLAAGKAQRTSPHAQQRSFIRSVIDGLSKPDALAEKLKGTPSWVPSEDELHQLGLARQLLCDVAHVDPQTFIDIQSALDAGQHGFANGLVDEINRNLAGALNFPHWWSQDSKFQLRVELGDFHLHFLITDRTGTKYSFDERSSGLKYFLSYFVQYLSHKPQDARPEILLMDEPDEKLSSQGQQDLLKIFNDFADPEDEIRRPCQVVYVTHSPFLIDKNHGQRIRVLDKGAEDEGTRVVQDAARNHYEPLRSAFGGFVAETAFIGNTNLMLEGSADQVLIAGMASRLTRAGTAETETLDLNAITLVAAGGAQHVPHMVYLARGRDVEKPAVVVLLDSDEGGDEAAKQLRKGGPRGKRIIDEGYVFQLGALSSDTTTAKVSTINPNGVVEIEDLIPVRLALAAATQFVLERIGSEAAASVAALAHTDVAFSGATTSTHSAVETLVASVVPDFSLDKVGFARGVLDSIAAADDEDVETLDENFRALFSQLGRRQRSAERERNQDRMDKRIKRARTNFLQDHPSSCTRASALVMCEGIEENLGSSVEDEAFRAAVRKIVATYKLGEDGHKDVEDYEAFKADLESLSYQAKLATQAH